ncbi:MAG: hypothetical protein AAGA60_09470 [Cyanobacteria bacterium P01_E01_bin.42]
MSQTTTIDLWKSNCEIVLPNASAKIKHFAKGLEFQVFRPRNLIIELSDRQFEELLRDYPNCKPRDYLQALVNVELNLVGIEEQNILLVDKSEPHVLIDANRVKLEKLMKVQKIDVRQYVRVRLLAKDLKIGQRLICRKSPYFGDNWIVKERDGFFVTCSRDRPHEETQKMPLWECEKYSPSAHFPLFVGGETVQIRSDNQKGIIVKQHLDGMVALQLDSGESLDTPVCNVVASIPGTVEICRGMGLISEFGIPTDLDVACEEWEISQVMLGQAIALYSEYFSGNEELSEPSIQTDKKVAELRPISLPYSQYKQGDKIQISDRHPVEDLRDRLVEIEGYRNGYFQTVCEKFISPDMVVAVEVCERPHEKYSDPPSPFEIGELVAIKESPGATYQVVLSKSGHATIELQERGDHPESKHFPQRRRLPYYDISKIASKPESSKVVSLREELRVGDRFYSYPHEDAGTIADYNPKILPSGEPAPPIKVVWEKQPPELRGEENRYFFTVKEFESLEVQKLTEADSRPEYRRKAKFIVPDFQSPVTSPNNQQPTTNNQQPIITTTAKIADDFATLAGCEQILYRLDTASLEAGRALYAIKFNLDDSGNPLFKSKAKTWKQYCDSTGRDRRTCDEYIQAWETSQRVVIPNGAKIRAIRSWLELDRVKEEYQQKVLDRAAESDKNITAKVISNTIAGLAETIEDIYKKPPEKTAPNTERLDLQVQLQQAKDERDRLQEQLDELDRSFEIRVVSEAERRIDKLVEPICDLTGIRGEPAAAIAKLLEERERMLADIEELRRQQEAA